MPKSQTYMVIDDYNGEYHHCENEEEAIEAIKGVRSNLDGNTSDPDSHIQIYKTVRIDYIFDIKLGEYVG